MSGPDYSLLCLCETRLRSDLQQLWPAGQDEILSVLSAVDEGPWLFVHNAAEGAKVQRPFNNHFVLNLQWISWSVLHFSFCLPFLFSTSLSLNHGSPVHTSVTWTQFSTVERTHQVVPLSLRGWYYGTFYLLGASEASCPSINELQRDVTDRNTQWAHLFDWRLSQALTSLFFPLTDSGALFGLNGAVMV